MNQESTNQVQGQESASIVDTATIQNQLFDTSNIQLKSSEVDKILQNSNLDKIVNMTSSLEISKSEQSTTTQSSFEAHKYLIRDLYNLLVCEKLPTTEKNEFFNKKVDEFVNILEVLSEYEVCDKIMNHIEDNENKGSINCEKSIQILKQDKLADISRKYESLKTNDALMKILFNEHYCKENQEDFLNYKSFNALKDFQSENKKFIFKDLCYTFERIVIPKTKEILLSFKSEYNLTWIKLNDSIKSLILNSFIDFQGFYIATKELIQDHLEHLQSLNSQQIIDIIKYGFIKVSKIEHLTTSIYLKRTFIEKNKEYFYEKRVKGQVYKDHTKNYHDFKNELEEKKFFIIADHFGTGKTTILKHFTRRFKEDDNELWISYIDARLSSKIFERIQKILDWNIECLADFMIKMLKLSGIELAIFKQKFIDNQVILLWDHIDEEFQPTLIDFAYYIKQLTENKQIFATQFQNSNKFWPKFSKISYKLIPLTSTQIRKFHRKTEEVINFHVDIEKFLKFCDSFELGERKYEDGRKVYTYNNILLYKLILQASADLKIDFDDSVDLYSLFERVLMKQVMDNRFKLTEKDEIMLPKFLQSHALKVVFGDELVGSLQIVKDHKDANSPISSLDGIFAVNFEDNSVIFQHTIIEQYFITTFLMDNVFIIRKDEITIKKAKILVIIIATIIKKYPRLFQLINFALAIKYKNSKVLNKVLNKLQENFTKIIKKSQYWPSVIDSFYPSEPKFIDNIDGVMTFFKDFDCWERFYRQIPPEDMKFDEIGKKEMKRNESKRDKNKFRTKPSVKGETSMKKLNCSHEISRQLDEFLNDEESEDSYDADDV